MLKALLKKSKKNQKGFTLIELLAVIVILAILAAIAIPSVVAIIQKQNNKAAAQDALMIIHAAKMYVADNNVTADKDLTNDDLKDYISKSTDKLPDFTVYYDATNNTYTIDDPDLTFSGVTTSSQGESDLIKYNQ